MVVAVTYLANCSDCSLLLPVPGAAWRPQWPPRSRFPFHRVSKCADPLTQFGNDCACFEDNTAYFENNIVMGWRNPQPSRSACQKSCARHRRCLFWTWEKMRRGWCYLKTSRAGVKHNKHTYVSGSKGCLLPEQRKGLW